jgi:hypothetical protein
MSSQPPEIPLPAVLDPDRGHLKASETSGSPEEQATVLREALKQASEYGQQLWHCLDVTRGYLLDSAPAEGRPGAAPAGPTDEQGWQDWQKVYAGITSMLAGPKGDSGFGAEEAARQAQLRRRRPDPDRSVPARPSTSGSGRDLVSEVGAAIAVAVLVLSAGKAFSRRFVPR